MNYEQTVTLCQPRFFLTKKRFCCIIIDVVCRCGEIGRHEGLKIPFWRQSAGSSPAGGMKSPTIVREKRAVVGLFALCEMKVFGSKTIKNQNGKAARPTVLVFLFLYGVKGNYRSSISLNRSKKLCSTPSDL